MKYFGVRGGDEPGVYKTFRKCLNKSQQYEDAIFQKFKTREMAQAFVDGIDCSYLEPESEPAIYKESDKKLYILMYDLEQHVNKTLIR